MQLSTTNLARGQDEDSYKQVYDFMTRYITVQGNHRKHNDKGNDKTKEGERDKDKYHKQYDIRKDSKKAGKCKDARESYGLGETRHIKLSFPKKTTNMSQQQQQQQNHAVCPAVLEALRKSRIFIL